ncbi:hypothetical protein JMJ35_001745 [Cladonia borealis]|uniref:Uncharacterized protein n=1 Tax=Cladonia borealis TaxID=184061 RepID=A0AA39UDP1_9LECA|nr:hypothetical protein JMJ35_001745 [Cladonia borealis]
MAPSNPKRTSKASSQTKPNSEPEPPSTTTISTSEATPPPSSETTHPALFSITTLHLASLDHQNPVYIVRPTQIWDSLSRYRHCIIPHIPPLHLNLHTDISLHRPSLPHNPSSPPTQIWYARILSIHAHSPQHVYLRTFYYYTPSQLPPSTHTFSMGLYAMQKLLSNGHSYSK